jgi:hypothetical protein
LINTNTLRFNTLLVKNQAAAKIVAVMEAEYQRRQSDAPTAAKSGEDWCGDGCGIPSAAKS